VSVLHIVITFCFLQRYFSHLQIQKWGDICLAVPHSKICGERPLLDTPLCKKDRPVLSRVIVCRHTRTTRTNDFLIPC